MKGWKTIYMAMLWTNFISKVNEEKGLKAKSIVWESEFNNIPKYLRNFRPKKGVLLVELWAWTLSAEIVLTIQHLLGCCILGETSQRRSAPVTKISQPRTWISLKRTSAMPQCCVHLFKLIIFSLLFNFSLYCFHYYYVFTNI